MNSLVAWKSNARGFIRFSIGIMYSSGTLAFMSMPLMTPGRPLPYTKNNSWSGSAEKHHKWTIILSEIFKPLLLHSHLPSSSQKVFIFVKSSLTLAGFAIAAEAEARAAAAGSGLVAVAQQTYVRAAPSFSELIQSTRVTTHWARKQAHNSYVTICFEKHICLAVTVICGRL